ncbi:LOW QUALITY PROTEIN: tyrosine kinase receptor Cad96Ca [Nilaparvata lugens]|uniref:LOW QUALITY PROTEIN: tyrosine kinase receptor Cad96Ca n=1 Tax=Nilaparvata lugens TaxID=108931 RepID=UPI00193DC137|nr:LOW QUALITY PROTEIN: tyrosine kinase receptor Cad96Ca [Nilaparvata lugens]
MDRLDFISILLLNICLLLGGVSSQGDNTPPVVWMERKWVVSETEPVGSVVTRVRGSDAEGDPLEFGLEHHLGFNVAAPDPNPSPLPFRIDNRTGVVYTNDSLVGKGGKDMFLYVTVTDGKLLHKSEVWVNVIGGGDDQSAAPRNKPTDLPNKLLAQYPRPPPPGGLGSYLPGGGFPPPVFPGSSQGRLPPHRLQSRLHRILIRPHIPNRPLLPGEVTVATEESTRSSTSRAEVEVATSTQPTVTSPIAVTDADLIIVTVVMVAVIVSISSVVACLFRRRICKRAKSKKDEMRKEPASSEEPMAMQHWQGPRAYVNRYESWDLDNVQGQTVEQSKLSDRWEFPRHHLKVYSILGEGCFGQVWRCEAVGIDGRAGQSVVAVKTLKENAGERERLDLLQELQVMKSLEPHPHVVRLLGCCTEKDPLFVIMEFIANGKLQSFLRNSRAQRCYDNMHGKSATLTSRDLTSFCYQVARGMDFLSSKGIIHRDLAARNILVDENHICKVADFGFARDLMANYVYERKSEGRLPIRWMAPESLYDNIFSVKSDIWSFGVLIWEIVTLGSTPYPGMAAAEVMRKVRDGYRLDKPEHCRRELYNIMFYCWDNDSKERPDFKELVKLLEQLLLTETEYIELDRFPDHSYYNMSSLSGEKL